jgi:hypothetical protein
MNITNCNKNFLKALCSAIIVGFAAQSPVAQIALPALINSDMILSNTTTCYTADSCVTIPAGITLSVDKGVKIRFGADTGAAFSVNGTLIINGTEDSPVEITLRNDAANSDTSRWGYIASDYGTLNLNYVNVSKAHRFVAAYYGKIRLNHCFAGETFASGTQDCVGVHYATEVLIEYCEFHGNPLQGADAIDCDSITNSGILRHNAIYDFYDDAFDIGTGTPAFTIEDNYVYHCSNGATVGEHSTAVFSRNVVVSCKEAAIETHTGSHVSAVNNTFYKNRLGIRADHLGADNTAGSADVRNTIFANTIDTLCQQQKLSVVTFNYCLSNTDTLPGPNNLHGQPQFVDIAKGNFSLQGNSPCINHGDPADHTDKCGKTIDIGAFEADCQVPTLVSAGYAGSRQPVNPVISLQPSLEKNYLSRQNHSLGRPYRMNFYRLDGKLVKKALIANEYIIGVKTGIP